jgi:hypothetical protein
VQFALPFLSSAGIHLAPVGFAHDRGEKPGHRNRILTRQLFDFDLAILRHKLADKTEFPSRGLVVALWSANAGAKAVMDALNVAYGETEKRSFIRLNLVGLALGKWRALLKERGAFHGQAAASVREGICGRSRSFG